MSLPVSSVRKRAMDELDCYVLLVVAAVWYLSNLGGALSIDEAIYAESGYGLVTGNPYLNPTHAIAPTAKYVTGLSQAVLGQSSFAVRLPAALFGLGTLYVTYRLGRRLRSRWLGLSAMVLVGTTYLFAHYSVRMMLDVPLAFFFTASLLAALAWRDDPNRRRGYLVGALVVATATTKIYGAVYALPVIALLVAPVVRSERRRAALASLRAPVIGGAALAVVLYAQFALIPHPPVVKSYGPAVETVLSIPILGNYAYVAGQAVAKNFLHLGAGHAVVVGGTVYQEPPVWTYLQWFYEHGGLLYLGGLGVTLLAIPVAAVLRRRRLLWLNAAMLVPLLLLSLLTVKFPRYVLPLYPLVVLGGLANAALLLAATTNRESLPRPSLSTNRRALVPGLVLALVILGATVAPSAQAQSAQTTIREDSGFDDAAAAIEAHAATTDGEHVVLSYHPSALRYYLDDDGGVTVENLDPGNTSAALRQSQIDRIESGEIDLVVVPTFDRRVRDTALYRYLRDRGRVVATVPTAPEGSPLVVYAAGPAS